MRFRAKLLTALLIQPLGVGSLFLTVWYLGNYVGIETQGYFSTLKSQIDLLTVLFAFGFPQTIIYQINNAGASRRTLITGFAFYTIIVSLILIAISAHSLIGIRQIWPEALWVTPTVILTTGILLFHRVVRGVFVTVYDDWRFSMITIAPMVLLALSILVAPRISKDYIQTAYLVSSMLAVAIMLWFLRDGFSSGNRPNWRSLWSNGFPVFLQSAAMAMQPAIAFLWIKSSPEGLTGVAQFSLGLYAYNAGILPITMVAPLLFNRWSSSKPEVALRGLKGVILISLTLIPLMAIVGVIVPPIIAWAFEAGYEQSVQSIRIMLLAIPFAFITLFSMPAFMAMGKFSVNAWLALIRLLTLSVGIYCLSIFSIFRWASVPELVAISWLIAEVVVAGIILWLMRHYRTNTSYQ
ncbi:hypothetical protein CSC67_05735 [Pusillimonas caeni]|uniref:oligosaccharide flippase family protein n=1 Tax=Pusillimonas caeni TaxID=1348472 RepID=UPI000E599D7C|nr:oligosaccharide flippase family protein [Pusillimonas caeni]TFL14846.1 hypothetical protein CSC67_05735 [Pusillimonas caeni]